MPAARGERRRPGARPRTASGRSCAGSSRRRRRRGPRPRPPRGASGPGPSATDMRWSATRCRSHAALVAGRRPAGRSSPAVEDRLGREHAGEQRLADALAGQRVGGRRGVADEQRTAAAERCPVDAGRDRPGLVGRLGPGVGAEHRPRRGAGRAAPATAASCPAATCRRRREDAEARRWRGRRAAGTTRRSRAAGRARTTRTAARPAGPVDVGEVLAERVPLAEVARLAEPELLAQRRPHAVGGDDVARRRRCRARRRRATIVVGRARTPRAARGRRAPSRRPSGPRRRARRRARRAARRPRRGPGPGAAGTSTTRPTGAHPGGVDVAARRARSPGRDRAPRARAARRW